jgi:hypothetical protein
MVGSAPVPAKETAALLASAEPMVRYSAGLLTVDVDDRPVYEVLALLREAIPLRLRLRDSVEKELMQQLVSVRFDALPLQSGLDILLQGRSFALRAPVSANEGKGTPLAGDRRPIELWLLGGSGRFRNNSTVMDPEQLEINVKGSDAREGDVLADEELELLAEASDEELGDQAIEALDQSTRYKAMVYLGGRPASPENAQVFIEGLHDEDPQVRWMALGHIFSSTAEVPTEALREVIIFDSDPNIRRQALAVLVHKRGSAAKDVLEEVRSGQDPEMSAFAEQLLADSARGPGRRSSRIR